MANPNLAEMTSIYGKSTGLALTVTQTTVIQNPAASGQLWKVNSIIVSNVDGVNNADVTVLVGAYHIAKTISVPNDATLVLMSKDSGIYLEEGITISAYASAASDLEILISYEIIS